MLNQKPSQQLKRRYILFSTSDKERIKQIILDYLGILGWAKASPIFVDDKSNNHANQAILSVSNKSLDDIRAAMELSKDNIKILRVSGTIKGLSK